MASAAASVPVAIEQTLTLFTAQQREAGERLRDGYIDVLGEQDPAGSRFIQRMMGNRVLPYVYERIWRPGGMRFAGGPGLRQERRTALRMLDLSSGDRVLDVGCGPGTFTKSIAEKAGEGLVVGVDASGPMLALGARRARRANVAYVRGDACALPFADGSFDAVGCFAALHLIEHPLRALDEIVRVLAPGGRVALLASCERDRSNGSGESSMHPVFRGVRIFGREEIPDALRERGLVVTEQSIARISQFISARKPGD